MSSLINSLKRALLDDLTFTVLVIVLVAVASFGLGKWATSGMSQPLERPVLVPTPISIPTEELTAATALSRPSIPTDKEYFVASVNGTKYHARTCPGARAINEENKIYFKTIDEAKAAGYTPAANCTFGSEPAN